MKKGLCPKVPKHRPGGGSSPEVTPEVLTCLLMQCWLTNNWRVYEWRSVIIHKSTPDLPKFCMKGGKVMYFEVEILDLPVDIGTQTHMSGGV